MVVAASLSLLLLASPSSSSLTQQELACSYNGVEVSSMLSHRRRRCMCTPPWRGVRCNQLPPPAVAGQPRNASYYAALLGSKSNGVFVAVCDPSDPQERADCTAGLAQALNRSGTVLIPRLEDPHQPGRFLPWPTRGMRFMSDDAVVIFEEGAEIEALKNSSYLFGCRMSYHRLGLGDGDLASAHGRSNLSIVGYGVTWRAWREDYMVRCVHSQFRMGFRINNCSDLEVAGLTIRQSGGDGMIITSQPCGVTSCQNIGASKRLLIRDVTLDKNYRQGMSVISAQDMVVENATFSNTNGTGPSGGVDLEPDSSDLPSDPLRITNVSFHDCVAINNSGSGFQGYFLNSMHICDNGTCPEPWNETSPYPLTVSFDNCSVIGGNGGWTFGSIMPNLHGEIVIRGGQVRDNKGPGVHVMSKALHSVLIRFVGHTITNVARGGVSQCDLAPFPYIYPRCCKTNHCLAGLQNTPINLVARHGLTPQIEGAIEFENCSIADDQPRPWLQMLGDPNPLQPPVPYPQSNGQGLWANVNLTNLNVTTLEERFCEPNVSSGSQYSSSNVSCSAASFTTTTRTATRRPPQQRQTVLDVSVNTQLFADDRIVSSMHNLSRTVHQPSTVRVVLRPDAPWERGFAIGIGATSVIKDDDTGKLRMYYSLRNASVGCGHGDQPPCTEHAPPQPNFEPSAGPILTALAESTDGGNSWVKPLLHRYLLRGSTANNILGPIFRNNSARNRDGSRPNISVINSVFIDPTSSTTSCLRYRGVSGAMPFSSCDGVSWRLDPHIFKIPKMDWGIQSFDTQGVVFWDPPCACYSFYTRFTAGVTVEKQGRPQFVNDSFFRTVRRVQSRSLDSTAAWVNMSVVMRADAEDNSTHSTWGAVAGRGPFEPMDYYGSTVWYDAETKLYWMAAVRFWHWGPGQVHQPGGTHYAPGTKDIVLATSRDGANFSFPTKSAWLRPTREGSTGSRDIWLATPGAVRVDDDDLFFLTRSNVAEGLSYAIDPSAHEWRSEIVLGRMRRDGLLSLDAPYSRESEASTLTTHPLRFQGRRLLVNLDAGGGGSLYVEVFRAGALTGSPLLRSVPLVANGVALETQWGGTPSKLGNATAIGALSGVPIVLRLIMQDCSLYSLRFAM